MAPSGSSSAPVTSVQVGQCSPFPMRPFAHSHFRLVVCSPANTADHPAGRYLYSRTFSAHGYPCHLKSGRVRRPHAISALRRRGSAGCIYVGRVYRCSCEEAELRIRSGLWSRSHPTRALPWNCRAPRQSLFGGFQLHDTCVWTDIKWQNVCALQSILSGLYLNLLATRYSMAGVDLDADPTDPSNGMGIIPRSVSTIFTRAREMKEQRGSSWTYSIKGSFIELYNEDLIDLLNLDDASGSRREVQIREDKDGHIIWGGLREVAVKSANEVMGLIRQGTAIRRTNETDMNAQSSRSHAIFSLTLTQRKFTGSGLPPRSSTPLPPGGRSPSRLARPVSTFNYGGASSNSTRVSSPTFGRPATPSFATAMSRGNSLRPASSLGSHLTDGRARNLDEDAGEWSTIVSKFHFVDLAGSERVSICRSQLHQFTYTFLFLKVETHGCRG